MDDFVNKVLDLNNDDDWLYKLHEDLCEFEKMSAYNNGKNEMVKEIILKLSSKELPKDLIAQYLDLTIDEVNSFLN